MKKEAFIFFIFFFILFLGQPALSISVATTKTVYDYGEEIVFSIDCANLVQNVFTLVQEKRQVFSEEFLCPESGKHSVEYTPGFLDPSGKWTAKVFGGNENAVREIVIQEKREAGFLLVKFLSPTSTTYLRGDTIVVSVEIIDAGEIVQDANAVFWGTDGTKYGLSRPENGKQFYEYEIPLDSQTGQFGLTVLAQRKSNGQEIGGTASISLEIEKSPIVFDIIEPQVTSFDVGNTVSFSINAHYPNKKPLTDGNITVVFGTEEIALLGNGQGNFTGQTTINQSQTGSLEAKIIAVDAYENTSTKNLTFVIGCSLTCIIQQFGPVFLGVALVAFLFFRAFFSKMKSQNDLKTLEAEKAKTEELIKTLQGEYFSKGVMPAASYKKNMAEYKAKIIELDEKIKAVRKTTEKK